MRGKLIILLALAAIFTFMFFRRGGESQSPEAVPDAAPIKQEQTQTAQTALAVQARNDLGAVSENLDGEGVVITLGNGREEPQKFVFEDVSPDAWCVDAVNFVASTGLMRNVITSSGRDLFCPDYGVTCAQFSMILYRFCDAEPARHIREYADVPEYEWYYEAIHWADRQGLIDRIDNTTFGAAEHLSCEEVLMALHRVAGKPESFASLTEYPYALKVSEKSMDAVRWAWGVGLIAEDECIWYPTQAISRAQLALLLMRYEALMAVQV